MRRWDAQGGPSSVAGQVLPGAMMSPPRGGAPACRCWSSHPPLFPGETKVEQGPHATPSAPDFAPTALAVDERDIAVTWWLPETSFHPSTSTASAFLNSGEAICGNSVHRGPGSCCTPTLPGSVRDLGPVLEPPWASSPPLGGEWGEAPCLWPLSAPRSVHLLATPLYLLPESESGRELIGR